MVLRTAAGVPHPEAVEFVRFCYQRRKVGWPELYDEMCAVAGRGLYRGFSSDDLGGIGVGFSLFDMPALATLASQVVAEEVALRRPVSVVLTSEPPRVTHPPEPHVTEATVPSGTSAADGTAAAADDRSVEVPIRLALAPSGA